MRSASASVRAIGFSTSTDFLSSIAWRIGSTCAPSLVETMTVLTSGRQMTAALSPEWNCAPDFFASSLAFPGSESETARNPTPGCSAARRARKPPMRPEPITATPSSLRLIGIPLIAHCSLPVTRHSSPVTGHRSPLLSVDADVRRLDHLGPLCELALDVLRQSLGRAADRLDGVVDEQPAVVRLLERSHDFAVDSRSEERRVGKECR